MNILTQNLPRLFTGLALVVLIAVALSVGGIFLLVLMLVVSLLGFHEFFVMFHAKDEARMEWGIGLVLTAGMILLAWYHPGRDMLPYSAAFIVLALFFLVRWVRDDTYAFGSVACIAAGLAYVPVLLLPALFLGRYEQILLICVPIFTDSTAYFCGVRFGRHKIWPKVSPKKSVEGSLAGLAASVMICVILGHTFGKAGMMAFAALGVILGVMAQLGDFFESALKRSCRIKDSGYILPGHGGVLDRIDSLLFVVPAYQFCRTFENFF